ATTSTGAISSLTTCASSPWRPSSTRRPTCWRTRDCTPSATLATAGATPRAGRGGGGRGGGRAAGARGGAAAGPGAGGGGLARGRRPTAVAVSPDGKRAFVANTHADSVSVVDLDSGRVTAEIALGPAGELSAADRGELLFHDARLSHDRWMSCHSC